MLKMLCRTNMLIIFLFFCSSLNSHSRGQDEHEWKMNLNAKIQLNKALYLLLGIEPYCLQSIQTEMN